MTALVPMWAQVVVAILIVASGLLALVAAVGLVRLGNFFQRLHPAALANTLAAWCMTLASILYFSTAQSALTLHPWLINILLAITAPVTTLLLARAALFRERQAGDAVPSPLGNGSDLA
jgi:multicomponent K+:H+ antiporter subunit G